MWPARERRQPRESAESWAVIRNKKGLPTITAANFTLSSLQRHWNRRRLTLSQSLILIKHRDVSYLLCNTLVEEIGSLSLSCLASGLYGQPLMNKVNHSGNVIRSIHDFIFYTKSPTQWPTRNTSYNSRFILVLSTTVSNNVLLLNNTYMRTTSAFKSPFSLNNYQPLSLDRGTILSTE